MEIEKKNLGAMIKAIMALNGIKTKDLAKKIGVSPSYISAVVHNKKQNPRILTLIFKELKGGIYHFKEFSEKNQDCYFSSIDRRREKR